MSKSQELRKYLDGLAQPYDDLSPERDREVRQVTWEVLLDRGLHSVCEKDSWNLKVKKRDGTHYTVKDNKTFIAGVFFTLNTYLNEIPIDQLKNHVAEVREMLLLSLHELKRISDQVALNPSHKTQKSKFKIPRKEKINQLEKDIRSWANSLFKGMTGPDAEKNLETVRNEKVREKLLIEQLYFCFRQYCPGLLKKDIYYNMAKISLWLSRKREERIKKQISLNEQLIVKEANRIQKNRQRHSRYPSGLQPFFCPPFFKPGEPPSQWGSLVNN